MPCLFPGTSGILTVTRLNGQTPSAKIAKVGSCNGKRVFWNQRLEEVNFGNDKVGQPFFSDAACGAGSDGDGEEQQTLPVPAMKFELVHQLFRAEMKLAAFDCHPNGFDGISWKVYNVTSQGA